MRLHFPIRLRRDTPARQTPAHLARTPFASTRWPCLLALVLCSSAIGCQSESHPPKATVPVKTNSIGMEFVEIPAGEFMMGASQEDRQAEPDEKPAHRVVLTQNYWLGRFEVTQAQYETVMGENPSNFGPNGREADAVRGLNYEQLPVEFVNWFEASEFCEKLSALPEEQKAGRSYRLPTEAEWEYACRAGTTTRFSFGDTVDPQHANYKGDVGHTLPVGSYPPNPFGLHDMHGNVLEWCADWHSDDYYKNSPVEDPTGPEISQHDVRVLRGGGYLFKAASSAFRDRISPYLRGSSHGFRVVMEQKEAQAEEKPSE